MVYLVGNHDAEVWWNPRIQRSLHQAGLADEFGCRTPPATPMLLALATRHWYRGALAVAVTAFGLLGWLLYDPLGLESAQLAVATAALVGWWRSSPARSHVEPDPQVRPRRTGRQRRRS